MSNLAEMAIEHPYYCATNNYFSNNAGAHYETASDFLDAFEDADIDYNLVFRWDIKERSEDNGFGPGENEQALGGYYAEVFIMGQRKGLFMPFTIARVTENELPRFSAYLLKHYKHLQKMWAPLAVPPEQTEGE